MGVALREVFARFGVEFDGAALLKGSEEVQNLTKKLVDFGKTISGPALLVGATRFVQGMVEQGQQLGDQARDLNMSASAMREWQHVAEASGLPIEQMNTGLQTLAAAARGAVTGNGDMAFAFRRLHVQVRDANRQLRPTGDLMAEVGLQVARVANPLQRARLATQMFGEAGRALLPVFERGGTSINAMREEVRDLASQDLDELAAKSREVRAEQARFKLATDALATTFALTLLPPFRWTMTTISGLIRDFKKWTDQNYSLQSSVEVLGFVFGAVMLKMGLQAAAAFGPAILASLPFIAAVGAIILLVDELHALFNGGPSIIGDWLDALGGAGTAQQVVVALKQAYDDVVESISRGIAKVAEFGEAVANNAVVRGILERLGAVDRDTNPRARRERLDDGRRTNIRGFQAPGDRSNAPLVASAESAAAGAVRAMAARGSILAGPRRVTPTAATNGARGTGDVRVNTNVGGITVNAPNADPLQVAEQVHERIERASAENVRAARRVLVPVVQSRARSENDG